MRCLSTAALCVAGALAFTAQTPPSPAPGTTVAVPMNPPRHLEFGFTASYFQSGESHDSGFNGDGSGSAGAGVYSTMGGGGRTGTIVADVVAVTADGGLVVKINEIVDHATRPAQVWTCLVYGDSRKTCFDMARSGIDPSRMDANNRWHRGYTEKGDTFSADYTMSDNADGKSVTIVEQSRLHPGTQNEANMTADTRVVYDRTMSVPDRIHQERSDGFGDSLERTTLEIRLAKDSFAKT